MHYECYKALQVFVIGVMDKPMKMAKNVNGFSAALCPKYRLRGNFKGGVPLLMGVAGANLQRENTAIELVL